MNQYLHQYIFLIFQMRPNELGTYIVRDLADYQIADKLFPENSKQVVPIGTEDDQEADAAGYEADDAEEAEDETLLESAGSSRMIKTCFDHSRGKQLYVHFGVEKAILGKSPGVIFYRKYQQVMRVIGTVHPELLTLELKKIFNSADLAYEEVCSFKLFRSEHIIKFKKKL